MKFKIEVCGGDMIPNWYGIAWKYETKDSSVCYVIPFNVIMRKARDIKYWFTGYGRMTMREHVIYAKALEAGRKLEQLRRTGFDV